MLGQAADGTQRIVFMGDSITEAWSRISTNFFEGKPYINRGISGQTTPQMLVRFRADVIELRPAVVVILAGTNDIAENTGPISLGDIAGNIASMAELARANGIQVVISSVLPAFDYPWRPGLNPDRKIPELNVLLETYARENEIVYLDYFKNMTDGKNGLITSYGSDGVHPTEAGYRVMEPMVENAIMVALAAASR
jgi:lysophospholipase L1-like esterase